MYSISLHMWLTLTGPFMVFLWCFGITEVAVITKMNLDRSVMFLKDLKATTGEP